MAIHIDMIDGNRARFARGERKEYYRYATVTGLSEDAAVVAGTTDILYAAVLALQAVPEYRAVGGDEHPTISGIYLEDILPESLSDDMVKVELIYRTPETPENDPSSDRIVEVGTALEITETNVDIDDAPITVTYNGTTTGVLIPVGRPRSTAVIRNTEFGSPLLTSRLFVGKVNSGGWAIDSGAEARTWLCTSITGFSRDNGSTFEVTREYAYDPNTHDVKVAYIDPETGRPPEDLVEGTGYKLVQRYEETNLNGSL